MTEASNLALTEADSIALCALVHRAIIARDGAALAEQTSELWDVVRKLGVALSDFETYCKMVARALNRETEGMKKAAP